VTLGLPERIESKISPEPNSGCWLWDGARFDTGYGKTFIGEKRVLAHRVVYELLRGPIPQGLQIDHLCRVRCCVNPDHMEPVTRVVNVMRGESPIAKNARKTHCLNGHEFSADNTYILKDKSRLCRACNRVAALASYHRNKKLKRP
jgi:hypothetical protein